jgi:hypothetical protein
VVGEGASEERQKARPKGQNVRRQTHYMALPNPPPPPPHRAQGQRGQERRISFIQKYALECRGIHRVMSSEDVNSRALMLKYYQSNTTR